jgi:hypothetical protein
LKPGEPYIAGVIAMGAAEGDPRGGMPHMIED